MIHPDDVAAWIAQVRQYPEAAPAIIEALAARLIELDTQNEALRDELIRRNHRSEASTDPGHLATLTQRVQTLERQLELSSQSGTQGVSRSMLVLTLDGRGARLPLPGFNAWRGSGDHSLVVAHLRPRHLLIASDGDDLLLLTDKGRAVRMAFADVDLAEAPINYLPLLAGLALDLDESVGVVIQLPSAFDRLTLVTRKGYVRSFRHAEVDSLLERKLSMHSSPVEGDYPAFALLSNGHSELLIATRLGKGVRFSERVVGVQASLAIKLDRGDVVAGAAVVDDGTTLALIGADGVAAQRQMAGFGAHATAGNRGKTLTRIRELVAAAAVNADDVLWLLTGSGQLHPIPTARVPSGPGMSRGKTMLRLGEDHVVALAVS